MPQLDCFSGTRVDLPDEAELQRRFAQFNLELFKSRLPDVSIRWSTRMHIAGTCRRHRALITLSWPYHERFPEDVDDTLKHEMIHLKYSGHGPAFRREAARVGASLHCREYEGIHPRANLVYACPTCWREFRRAKPSELYCGRCSRGRLLPQFRLVLIRELNVGVNGTYPSRAAAKANKRSTPRKKTFNPLISALSLGLPG